MEKQEWIKTYREKLGISQADFAKKIGVSAPTLCRYENGQRELSFEMVVKITRELGIAEIDDFGCSDDDNYELQRKRAEAICIFNNRLAKEEHSLSEMKSHMESTYNSLNVEAQKKVIQYVEDLAGNPKYKKLD